MNIQLKKLSESALLPVRGSEYAAGYDLFSDIDSDVSIAPHETKLIGTGISVAIPDGYFGGIYARSGLSSKEGLRPANCTGVIDSDYFYSDNEGHIFVKITNHSDKVLSVKKGEAFVQGIFMKYYKTVDDDTATDRNGGIGSTN